jgi:hypothetical protein
LPRTYKTLSLSLPPDVADQLATIGKATGRAACRVAADQVKAWAHGLSINRQPRRQLSWCCQAPVKAVQGVLVVPETAPKYEQKWVPVIVALCPCGKQMHGEEYEGLLTDVEPSRFTDR